MLTIAAELAIKRETVKGPGTFLAGFIDAVAELTPETILEMANVRVS